MFQNFKFCHVSQKITKFIFHLFIQFRWEKWKTDGKVNLLIF